MKLLSLHQDILVVLNNFLSYYDILQLAETCKELLQRQCDFLPYAIKKLYIERPKSLHMVNNFYVFLSNLHEFIEVQDMNLYYYTKRDTKKYANIPDVLQEKKRLYFAWNEVFFLHPTMYINYYKHRIFFVHDSKKKLLIYSKKKFMLCMFLKNPNVENWLCPTPLVYSYN